MADCIGRCCALLFSGFLLRKYSAVVIDEVKWMDGRLYGALLRSFLFWLSAAEILGCDDGRGKVAVVRRCALLFSFLSIKTAYLAVD
jgi:hypothetical protein